MTINRIMAQAESHSTLGSKESAARLLCAAIRADISEGATKVFRDAICDFGLAEYIEGLDTTAPTVETEGGQYCTLTFDLIERKMRKVYR